MSLVPKCSLTQEWKLTLKWLLTKGALCMPILLMTACLVHAQTMPSSSGSAQVRSHHGVPTLFVNGRPNFPIAMIPIDDFPTDACREFADAGIRLYSHIIWSWRSITPGSDEPLSGPNRWWLGPGQYDFEKLDRRLEAVLAAHPDACLFPRVKLDPPDWWVESHPEDLTRTEDGKVGIQHSMASRAWEETYGRMLRDLVGHIESSRYADRVIGYQLAGGKSSEWFWWGFDKGLIDFSPAAKARFREWLRERYNGSVNSLREAWRQPNVTFESADPPPGTLRETSEYGLFRDAAVAQPAIDYVRFLSDITAHNIIRSCRIVKEITGGRKITGAFYGYMLHFAHCRLLVANEGMCGFEQVLHSPYVDFLSSPPQYERRRGGHPGLFQTGYFGSIRLHNKFFWQEADDRTHLAKADVHYRSGGMDETLGMLDRQLGYALTEMNGLWWFTLAGDDTFSDETLMKRVARISEAAQEAVEHRGTRRHDVAIFADEETYAWMQMGPTALCYPLITDMRRMLIRTGVVHDFFLQSDIAHPELPDYRMYIFLNAFRLSDATRKAIAAKVCRNNAVAVWFYAPGFMKIDGTLDERGVEDLTGIRVRHVRQSAKLALDVKGDHPIVTGITERVVGTADSVDPVFFIDDPSATVLGTLSDLDKPGLAVREFKNWRSVYFAAPTMTPALFRNLARYAGCHVYSESDDVFNANSRYLMLHAVTPGTKTIALPASADVRNVMNGEWIGHGIDAIRFEAAHAGDTRLFELRN